MNFSSSFTLTNSSCTSHKGDKLNIFVDLNNADDNISFPYFLSSFNIFCTFTYCSLEGPVIATGKVQKSILVFAFNDIVLEFFGVFRNVLHIV